MLCCRRLFPPLLVLMFVFVSSFVVGCKQEPEPVSTFRVEFDADSLTLRFMRESDELLRFPADALQLAHVDAINDGASYDPYFPMKDVTWAPVTGAEALAEDDAAVALVLTFEGGATATLRIEESAVGRFRAIWIPIDGEAVVAFRLRPRVDPMEGFYGLGEYFDTPSHRGKSRAMQLEIDSEIESNYNEAHVPVPLLIGTRGWGLFVEDPHPAVFDVATEADDLVQITFGTGPHGEDGLLFHLFGAFHPLDVTKHYYDVTGSPALPARWALGPWIWRDENVDQAEVESDANIIRDMDLATSALWIDRPYATGVNTFDFEVTRFPDPQGMIDLLHDLGFRVALWHTPYVSDGNEPALALHDIAAMNGYFPPDPGLQLNSWSDPIDFTNPEAFDWWQGLLQSYVDLGIEGFKLDYGEDVTVGLLGARTPWLFADGSDERTMHARYQLYYHRAYAEMLPPEGGFLLCRGGTYGDQTSVSIVWPGDLDASMTEHREMATDGGSPYVSVGGLPAAVAAGLSLGPSGFPLFASDTGGYRHSPPDKETFTRWFEHTALTVVMQIGTSSNDVAWEFTAENGFDAEMLGWYREYTRLHLRLFPYLWTHVTRVAIDGRPILRALGLAYPELGEHPPDVYLLGDDLLVAPVVRPGELERTLTFPPGTWVDWFTGDSYEGEQTVTVDAPLAKLPLFLRAGGIVPLLRPTIDTLAPTVDPVRVDSYDSIPGMLHPRIVPGAASSFLLFDGARLTQELAGDVLTLTSSDGSELRYGALFEVIAVGAAPAVVSMDGATMTEAADRPALDGMESGWAYDPGLGGTLLVKVPAGDHTVVASR